MTPAGHQKFLFDRDFDKDEEEARLKQAAAEAAKAAEQAANEAEGDEYGDEFPEAPQEPEAPPPPSYSEADLAQAREEGRAEGRDEATCDMAGAIEQRTAQTLDAINGQMTQLFEMYELDKEQHSRDAVAVAEVIVRKLFPALNMDKALAEIEHMIVEAMKRTSGSPMLMVRVSEDMHAQVEARAQELAALRGREGTVNVIGDADVAPGDARVEWDGGGMVRDTGLIWREIDDIIERNLGERITTDGEPAPASAPAPELAPEPAQAVEAEVVNPALVGDNMETVAESPESVPSMDTMPTDAAAGPAAPQEDAGEDAGEDIAEQDEPQALHGDDDDAGDALTAQDAQEKTPDADAPEGDMEEAGPAADADATDQDDTET